jgi:hypothetical protein
MQDKDDPWNKTFYERAIQTRIGQTLRDRYDLTEPMPQRIRALLLQLDETEKSAPKPAEAPGAGSDSQGEHKQD